MRTPRVTWQRVGLLITSVLSVAVIVKAQEHLGTVKQPVVGGTVINAAKQEEFALLGYTFDNGDGTTGVCSASLLRNGWVVTAAHCVDKKDSKGNFIPDPRRPGQNIIDPLAQMTISANWPTPQSAKVVRVETFRPYDVALIQVDKPFKIGGSTTGFSRLVFQDGQFPYFGNPVGADLIIFGRGINQFASGSGATATPSVNDGQYRIAYAKSTYMKDDRFWYPSVNGQMIAGGDSGGPSFAWVMGGYALVGVHSLANTTFVPGKPKTGWTWATSTPEAADAPLAPVWPNMVRIMGPASVPPVVSLSPPPPGYIGTFARTPPGYQPIWLYAIRPNGELMWYRKDSSAAAWQGPKRVGTGWNTFKEIIPAGGNRFYALTQDNRLLWYQHVGFNDGSNVWKGPIEVARDWNFVRIFGGGDGVVYGVRADRNLVWTRNNGANHEAPSWQPFKIVRPGFIPERTKLIFSEGKGDIYSMDAQFLKGRLMSEQHDGWATGENKWQPTRIVGVGWDEFAQIIPCGDGVMLGLRPNGELLWYRHRGRLNNRELWDNSAIIGTGWQEYTKVFAVLPDPPTMPH